MNFPSKLVEEAVNAFAQLPGIGKKTALRLVLYLLKEDRAKTERFTADIARMRQQIKFCKTCHNLADHEQCEVCSNPKRNHSLVCIVEDFRDVMAIESTQQYKGVYHVLEGVISPMDGIGPEDINIDTLLRRVRDDDIEEVIMALSPTVEGDTTIYYLSKHLRQHGVKVTTLARGVSFGGELEYADEVTLARSIQNRLPYDSYFAEEETDPSP